MESCLDEERLLSVLTNGSTGRNPTFFKAYGHEDVFGLKSAIPDGCSTLEIAEDVPKLDAAEDSDEVTTATTNVLYVKLPEGHPVITGSEVESESKPEMSIEEAIEQAEIIFEDTTEIVDPTKEVKVDVTPTISVPETSTKRVSPRLKENHESAEETAKKDEVETTTSAPIIPMHNLRPKRTLRHVQALKQQAKRRKRNTNLASPAGSSSSVTRVSSVTTKKSTFHSNGDIEIHYKAKQNLSDLHTMKEVLQSISGFNVSKLRKKMSKKSYSITAAIQMANEGSIDLETPDSILSQVNLRTLLNKSTFLKLPPEYQYKLSLLLPNVDRHEGKLNHSSFNNEFFAKACQEWKERLLRGDFTLENLTKTKADIERDKQKTDPWKVTHFEPVWGVRKLQVKVKDDDDDEMKDELPAIKRCLPSASRSRQIDNEDEPLLKKVKAEPTKEIQVEMEQPKIDDDQVEEETTEETVIEEPVNLLEEQDSISEPPLRSCSIDFEETEVVSIPSPIIATPAATPPSIGTPVSLPTEPLPATPPITVTANSPASVRSVRGNSITFSSSRSPSPAASMASLSSAQEDLDEPIQEPIDPSLLQTKTVIKPAKMRTNPTAILNKIRPPQGDVNLERSMEIVQRAVEKSVVNQQNIMRAPPMIIRPVQPSPRPPTAGQVAVQPMTSAPQAVLVTTTDGKTLLAHPASQILRPMGPQGAGQPVRVRLPVAGAKVTPISAQPRPQVQQVVQLIQQPKQPVFRMPTTTSTMVLDSSQINTLIVSTCTTRLR